MSIDLPLSGCIFTLSCNFVFFKIVLELRIMVLLMLLIMLNQVQYLEDETAPTGTCAVCVVGGER